MIVIYQFKLFLGWNFSFQFFVVNSEFTGILFDAKSPKFVVVLSGLSKHDNVTSYTDSIYD